MIRTTTLIALGTLALAACNKDDSTIVAGPADPMANELANAKPVELPPSIVSSKSYRCKDNSLLFVDWLSNGGARVKKSRDEVGTELAAGSTELTGDSKSSTITYNGKSCKG